MHNPTDKIDEDMHHRSANRCFPPGIVYRSSTACILPPRINASLLLLYRCGKKWLDAPPLCARQPMWVRWGRVGFAAPLSLCCSLPGLGFRPARRLLCSSLMITVPKRRLLPTDTSTHLRGVLPSFYLLLLYAESRRDGSPSKQKRRCGVGGRCCSAVIANAVGRLVSSRCR